MTIILIQEQAISVFVELQKVSFNGFAFGIANTSECNPVNSFQHVDVVLR